MGVSLRKSDKSLGDQFRYLKPFLKPELPFTYGSSGSDDRQKEKKYESYEEIGSTTTLH
jgi:hypothetical protein